MSSDAALVELLHLLRLQNYRHTAVTPKTHETVLARPLVGRPTLSDILGWSRPFQPAELDPPIYELLERADALEAQDDGRLRSKVRVASLGADLFVHSAFPTNERDAVFFGPDTYRFVRFLEARISGIVEPEIVADMGTGSGAGGIAAAGTLGNPTTVLVDINPQALRYARVNAAAAEIEAVLLESDRVPECDLLVGNAPYLMDAGGRAYRDGGKLLGGAVSLDWIEQGLRQVRPGGTILLYTGAAYVRGQSPLLSAVEDTCGTAGVHLEVQELDPDVFGEQLREPGYEDVERIAAVGIVIRV